MTTNLVRINPTLSEIKESLQEIYGDRTVNQISPRRNLRG
jgi:hypothetical protein